MPFFVPWTLEGCDIILVGHPVQCWALSESKTGLVKMLGVSPTKNGRQEVTPDPAETNSQHGWKQTCTMPHGLFALDRKLWQTAMHHTISEHRIYYSSSASSYERSKNENTMKRPNPWRILVPGLRIQGRSYRISQFVLSFVSLLPYPCRVFGASLCCIQAYV